MSIDRKCEIILEKLRLEYISPKEAMQQLLKLYRSFIIGI